MTRTEKLRPPTAACALLLVLASGAGKADAVARALEGPFDTGAVPVQLARSRTWIVDRDAASGLRDRPDGRA